MQHISFLIFFVAFATAHAGFLGNDGLNHTNYTEDEVSAMTGFDSNYRDGNTNYTEDEVSAMTGFDSNYRYGSMSASRLIVMLVGTFPSTCTQTGQSFFGNPANFASTNNARILCVFRPGTQYSFNDVPTIVRNVNSQIAQMNGNPTLFVAGYSNGGGVGACVARDMRARGFANWAATADWPARGCDQNIARAALYVTTGDIYRSMVLNAWNKARVPAMAEWSTFAGDHVTPMATTTQALFWGHLFQ